MGILHRTAEPAAAATGRSRADAIRCQREAIGLLCRLISLGQEGHRLADEAGFVGWLLDIQTEARHNNLFAAVFDPNGSSNGPSNTYYYGDSMLDPSVRDLLTALCQAGAAARRSGRRGGRRGGGGAGAGGSGSGSGSGSGNGNGSGSGGSGGSGGGGGGGGGGSDSASEAGFFQSWGLGLSTGRVLEHDDWVELEVGGSAEEGEGDDDEEEDEGDEEGEEETAATGTSSASSPAVAVATGAASSEAPVLPIIPFESDDPLLVSIFGEEAA